jgi:hypothetical protein
MKASILSLCDHSGIWSRPYEEAGYEVIRVDLQNAVRRDVRLNEWIDVPIRGILAAPPCDHFAASGARWWEGKGEDAILGGLAIVDACLRAVAIYRPVWWALENPVGRLRRWLGPPAWSFDPCDFGLTDEDAYTKKTLLWGNFTPPVPLFSATARNPLVPVLGSKMHRMSSSWKAERSETPEGFAKAFFEVNQ